MRDPIRATSDTLACPPLAEREAARAAAPDRATHDRVLGRWRCLHAAELRNRSADGPPPPDLTVTAWNMERCRHVEDMADRLAAVGADVVLATEMDVGMARTGQRHTVRALADRLGLSHAFGVEFVELGLGDENEAAAHRGEANSCGLHGNAILSRLPLLDVAILPIGPEGRWYVDTPKGDGQLRVGGRMAAAARVLTTGGPLTVAAVHFESQGDAQGRAGLAATLVQRIDRLYGDGPAVIGGDLNTKALPPVSSGGPDPRDAPEVAEPCFAAFRGHGYDWTAANTPSPTTRPRPGQPPDTPRRRLDWLLTRQVAAGSAFVRPALDAAGRYLSDHEMIGARVRCEPGGA